jgi:thiamine biosynthesis lipoprotein ApbE
MQANKRNKMTKLTKEEIVLISNVLYNTKWTGGEFHKTITPLLNKLSEMVKELEPEKKEEKK